MSDDSVELGEIRMQYSAPSDAAKEEIAEFQRELRAKVKSLEHVNGALESHSFPEFDARLTWSESDSDE